MYSLKQTTTARQTMKHTAKRINAGDYEYRGWFISKKDCGWITFETVANATDVCETLSEAKDLINYYLDEMEKF